MTLAHALPVTGCRMLKAGCWLLVAGLWWEFKKREMGIVYIALGQRMETRTGCG